MHDSNFSRAQRDADRLSDTGLALRAGIDRSFGDVTVGADARLMRFTRAHGASFFTAGANGGWRRKLGLGREAPWIAADASASVQNAEERVRDALRGAFSLSTGRRFGGKPFSVQGRSVFMRAGYAVGAGVELTGSFALRPGDVESSTRRNTAIFGASNAIAPDFALGADFIAYRLSGARTRTLSAGFSLELSRRSALDASLARETTTVGGGLDYDSTLFALNFVHRP